MPAAANTKPANDASLAIVRFSVADEEIAALKTAAEKIDFSDRAGYEDGRKLLHKLVTFRNLVDKERLGMGEDSRKFIARVNKAAKDLTTRMLEIETPLQAKKDAADQAKADTRRAEEDRKREAMRLEEERKLAEQKAALEAQARELAEAQAKAAEERRKADETMAAERAKLEADRQAVEAERARVEAMQPKPAPVTEVESKQTANDSAPNSPLRHTQILSGIRNAEPRSDAERLRQFASLLRGIESPKVESVAASALVEQVELMLEEAAQSLVSFAEESEKES